MNEAQGKETDFSTRVEALKQILGIQNEINGASTTENKTNTATAIPTPTHSDEEIKKRISKFEELNNAEMASIKKRHLEGISSEDQYNAELLQAEFDFLQKKLSIYKNGSNEYNEIMNVILDKRLKIQEEVDKKNEKDKKEALENELKDLNNQQKNELAAIKKHALSKGFSEEQTNALLITKEIEYLNKKLVLQQKYGEDTADVQASIQEKINDLAENAAKGDADREKDFADLNKKYLDEEVIAEQEKIAALTALDQAYKAGLISSEEEYQRLKTAINKEYEKNRFSEILKYAEAGQQILGGVSDYFSALKDKELAKAGDNEQKKEAIEAKYAKKQQSIAAFQAAINGAVAIMQMWAQKSVLPEPANSIYKGVMSGIILATTIAQVSAIKSKSFASGGFTGNGQKYEPAGIVHKGEYVVPADLLRSPSVSYMVEGIEQMRKARYTITPGAMQASRTGGASANKATSNNTVTYSNLPQPYTPAPGLSPADVKLFSDAVKQLSNYRPELIISEYEKKKENWLKVTTGGLDPKNNK